MIGNDIVDLDIAAIESNWQRKGFIEKIFTMSERFLIHSANDPTLMVWLMWTMKEATYKAATDRSKIRSFAPCALNCNNLILHEESATGNVIYQNETYFCLTELHLHYIHTIAALDLKMLREATVKISNYEASDRSYQASKPDSVSHHGAYLALTYI